MKQKNLHSREAVATEPIVSENRYQTLINSIPAGIYTCDKDGSITFHNDAAAKLWGCWPKKTDDLIHYSACFKLRTLDGTLIAPEEAPIAIAIKTEHALQNVEVIVERIDGTRFYASENIEPLYDDNNELTGAINIFQDITTIKETQLALRESEAKNKRFVENFESSLSDELTDARAKLNDNVDETERAYREIESRYRELAAFLENKIHEKTIHLQEKNEQLKHSEERYHKMVEEVEDYAIILLDKEGNIQNWNKGAEKIKGYSEHEIVGKNFSNFYLPEDRESGLPQTLINRARVEGKAVHEGWRMRKDGSAFWGSVVLTALHDNLGNIIGFTKVTRDLTERKVQKIA